MQVVLGDGKVEFFLALTDWFKTGVTLLAQHFVFQNRHPSL